MSVEPSEITDEVWERWQGHLINGAFPLGRFLGSSDHSGVFLTRSAARPADVAIKLVPTNRALAESLLPRWKRAGGLTHPHLLRLYEWGGCQLDGLPYLYAVMEYADQTLAQLLMHRALTEDEAREMLLPTLEALSFLHGRNLLQGQLKASNILVVGDQLKLASDTVHRVTDARIATNTPTVWNPPEARSGNSSTAGDVWALGATLFEALTRRSLSGRGEPTEAVVLPPDFPAAFRDVVAHCLSPGPQDRPSVSELMVWARGGSEGAAPAATTALVAPEPPETKTPEPAPPPTAPGAVPPTPSAGQAQRLPALLTVLLGAVVILILGWAGLRAFKARSAAGPTSPVQAPAVSPSQVPGAPQAAATAGAPVSSAPATSAGRSVPAVSTSGPRQVTPEVPWSARRTIRGHIKVWVRVIVDQDGSVFAAVADRSGPSGYFQRLAIDAAKQWTFPPADTPSRRVMQVRFDFSREGTTGHAVPLKSER